MRRYALPERPAWQVPAYYPAVLTAHVHPSAMAVIVPTQASTPGPMVELMVELMVAIRAALRMVTVVMDRFALMPSARSVAVITVIAPWANPVISTP